VAIVVVAGALLAGCGTDRRSELVNKIANQAFYCVVTRVPKDAEISVREGITGEQLWVKWPDGEIAKADAHSPVERGVNAQWAKPPTAEQQKLIRGCGL